MLFLEILTPSNQFISCDHSYIDRKRSKFILRLNFLSSTHHPLLPVGDKILDSYQAGQRTGVCLSGQASGADVLKLHRRLVIAQRARVFEPVGFLGSHVEPASPVEAFWFCQSISRSRSHVYRL